MVWPHLFAASPPSVRRCFVGLRANEGESTDQVFGGRKGGVKYPARVEAKVKTPALRCNGMGWMDASAVKRALITQPLVAQ